MLHCMATINIQLHHIYTGTHASDESKQINKKNAHYKSTKLTTLQHTTHITHDMHFQKLLKLKRRKPIVIFYILTTNPPAIFQQKKHVHQI